MILCWNEGQASTIHDHADSHCFMKVLKGALTEIKYSWPNETSITNLEPVSGHEKDGKNYEHELQEISRSSMNSNEVFYINGELLIRLANVSIFLFQLLFWLLCLSDNIGLHRVENASNVETAVSLHLYCPPFDACSIFNKGGQRTQCQVRKQMKFNPELWSM